MEGADIDIKYISVDEIIEIHKDILDKTGGEYGILNKGNIEFTVDFIEKQIFTVKITDIFHLAALLTRDIISGHPFVDGNKRTGMSAVDVFLRKNGYYLDLLSVDGVKFALAVAKNEMYIESIREWLMTYSKKIINKTMIIEEARVKYMKDMKKKELKEETHGISEETRAIIKESIRKNIELLKELAKY